MRDWVVLALALAYLALLFLIAWAGDRRARRRPARAPAVYALSIGVYCTSWTLYGAVGVAAEGGLDYLAIYVGPILVMGLGWPLIARMIRIARAENVVSISDFISARYGKSRGVAVLVTVTAAVGLLPYFALQLKAITISFEALASDAAEGAVGGLPGGTTLIVAAAMAAFAVLFGVRSVNANEPHRGLMLAVATESVVKLAAALVVGGAVAFFAFDAPGGLVAAVRADPELGAAARLRPARPGLVGDLPAGGARLPLPAAAVPRRGGREHPPRRRAHRRLGLPALPRRHQPLRAAGGDRRADAVPRRRRCSPTPSWWRSRASSAGRGSPSSPSSAACRRRPA